MALESRLDKLKQKYMGAPSSLMTEYKEYGRWELSAKKEMPIKYWALFQVGDFLDNKTGKFFKKLEDIKYWFLYRFHPSHRSYWNIQPKTMKPGYYDHDWRFLHCSMHILCDFYECTTTGGSTDWSYDEVHRNALAAMKEIYDWWTIDRISKQKEIDLLYDQCYDISIDDIFGDSPTEDAKHNSGIYNQINTIEEIINDQDKFMLHKLVDVRQFLWD